MDFLNFSNTRLTNLHDLDTNQLRQLCEQQQDELVQLRSKLISEQQTISQLRKTLLILQQQMARAEVNLNIIYKDHQRELKYQKRKNKTWWSRLVNSLRKK